MISVPSADSPWVEVAVIVGVAGSGVSSRLFVQLDSRSRMKISDIIILGRSRVIDLKDIIKFQLPVTRNQSPVTKSYQNQTACQVSGVYH
jgi:hypothetical protein